MSERVARDIAVKLRQAEQARFRNRTRQIMDDGGRLRVGGGGKTGVGQPAHGFTGHDQGAEPPLGNPAANGYVLSSTTAGVRSWIAQAGGVALSWFDVTDYANIAAAVAALTAAGGGVLYFPKGTYNDAGGHTLSVPTVVLGDGMGSFDRAESISRINCTSQTAKLFTVTAKYCRFERIALVNTAGSLPTAGSAAVYANSAYLEARVDFESCHIARFYDNVDIAVGAQWSMDGCQINSFMRYGIRINNTVNADAGDWSISNTSINAGTQNSTAAIRLESSGGGKLTNVKTNGGEPGDAFKFDYALDMDAGAVATSILVITGCSFEGYLTDGIRLTGPNWDHLVIVGCQIAQSGNAASRAIVASDLHDLTIWGLTIAAYTAAPVGIQLTNVTRYSVGGITNNGFAAILAQTGSTGIDATSGAGGAAGGVLAGTYPNPSFAADMATQAELDAHVAAADPHPQYLTEAEGDALYAPLGVPIETYGIVFNGGGDVALRGDGTIATKVY